MIRTENHGNIAVLHMEHGKVNALDREFLNAIREAFVAQEISDSKVVVITGRETVFSAGVDLFRILEGNQSYTTEFVGDLDRMLEELFLFPKPVIAAVNGHAIAGGCIIALASDYKLMCSERGTIGVPELLVGVPFPSLPLEIVRFAVSPHVMQEMIYTGVTYGPQAAQANGVVNELVSSESLLTRALSVAEKFCMIPTQSFSVVKERLRAQAVQIAKSRSDEDIRGLWNSPEIHATIRAYLDRTIRKK